MGSSVFRVRLQWVVQYSVHVYSGSAEFAPLAVTMVVVNKCFFQKKKITKSSRVLCARACSVHTSPAATHVGDTNRGAESQCARKSVNIRE